YAILIAVGVIIVLLISALFMTNIVSRLNKAVSEPEKVTEDMVRNQTYTADNMQDRISIQDSAPENRTTEIGIDASLGHETEPSVEDIQAPPVHETVAPAISPIGPDQSPVQTDVNEPLASVQGRYNLTAYVMERTYIRIYVDNEPPREFIFSPGSYPQWKADEGFFLLIGNAAGVEFDFNGKRITALGKTGDVVRLRLPEDFNPNINE
ncbi:MAG: DUF4115 domain-containing protein, partial [Deltaproteobacteria bacterium]|nr:DUF4115 domain-containing protein [Deltaproteobacteria bacterium]